MQSWSAIFKLRIYAYLPANKLPMHPSTPFNNLFIIGMIGKYVQNLTYLQQFRADNNIKHENEKIVCQKKKNVWG